MLFLDKIQKRADGIREWLRANHPEVKAEQAHLDEGTPERAYWHAGYSSALTDILRLLDAEMTNPVN